MYWCCISITLSQCIQCCPWLSCGAGSGTYNYAQKDSLSHKCAQRTRAVATTLFQPRQRGKVETWGHSPNGVQGQSPWSGGQSPWSWKLFSSWMPKGNGKCATILLFYDLFIIEQKCLKLHIYKTMLWWSVIGQSFVKRFTYAIRPLSVLLRSVMSVGQ